MWGPKATIREGAGAIDRRKHRAWAFPQGQEFPPGEANGDRVLQLRLFRPAGDGPFPLIVILHPGG